MSVDTPSTWTIKDGLGVSQSAQRTQDSNGNTTPQVALRTNGAPVEAGNPLPVQDAVAGAVLGTPADAAWGGSGSGTVVSLLKTIAENGSGGGGGTAITSVVVDTTTLSPGAQATGSGSISGSTLTLDLGIPTGATGATGATGPAGSGGSGSTATPVTYVGNVSTLTVGFPSGNGNVAYDISLTEALTINLTPAAAAGYLQKISLIIRQPATGTGYSVTLPPQGTTSGSVRYAGGVLPTVSTTLGQITFIQFLTSDGGVTVIGQ